MFSRAISGNIIDDGHPAEHQLQYDIYKYDTKCGRLDFNKDKKNNLLVSYWAEGNAYPVVLLARATVSQKGSVLTIQAAKDREFRGKKFKITVRTGNNHTQSERGADSIMHSIEALTADPHQETTNSSRRNGSRRNTFQCMIEFI